MTLYTVQPKEIVKKLMNGYTHTTRYDKVDLSYHFPYTYMTMEMIARHIKGVMDIFPVWAWYRYNWKTNLSAKDRKSLFYTMTGHGKGVRKKYVLLELEVPDECVLLSDENDWISVLNDSYLNPGDTEESYDFWYKLYESFSNDKKIKVKLKSYQKIFDIKPRYNGWRQHGRNVQATFWELKPEYIKKVYKF